jgi:hypothetical protein
MVIGVSPPCRIAFRHHDLTITVYPNIRIPERRRIVNIFRAEGLHPPDPGRGIGGLEGLGAALGAGELGRRRFFTGSCGGRRKKHGKAWIYHSCSLTRGGEIWYKYLCFSTPPLATDGRMRSTAEEQGAPYVADRLGIVEPAGFNMPIISFLGRKPT